MGKKYKRIIEQLAWLNARTEDLGQLAVDTAEVFDALYERVRELEADVLRITAPGDDDIKNVWEHLCRFMPPGFRIKNTAEDFNDWRIVNGLDLWSPRLNYCPYCGAMLCEPEMP
jgi:hypothetical protein